jgi:hypothetical protein
MSAKKKRAPSTPAPAAKKKPLAVARPPKEPTPAPAAASVPAAKKYSALDATALVLRETGQPMSCPELIAQMAAKGYWTSPKASPRQPRCTRP